MNGRLLQLGQILVLICALGPARVAAVQLDQFQLDGTEQNQAIHSIRTVGQTFTAGLNGLLDSLELSLFESGSGGDLTVEVLDMSGGDLILAPVLGSVSVAETDLGPAPLTLDMNVVTATLIDLSSLGVSVTAGDLLAFRLSSARVNTPPDDINFYAIRTAVFSDLYPGGAYFVGETFTDGDAAFKVFVDVPEPNALFLLSFGLAGLGFVTRQLR